MDCIGYLANPPVTPDIVAISSTNAAIAPFCRPVSDMGIAPLVSRNSTSALPRRTAMGMDDMFDWKTKLTAPPKRSIEMTGAYDGGLGVQTQGLMAGTKVASNLGWRAIEALAVGDSVLTFDHGMQPITEIRRRSFWLDAPDTNPAGWPVIVPVGALDNRQEMTLLADQGVMVECDAAADAFGDPFVVVPALALDGVRGIQRAAPAQQVELIAIYFEHAQVIHADGGALIHCPTNTVALDVFLNADVATYAVLSPRDAAFVAGCLEVEDRMLASGGWCDGQAAVRC
jgi:hypothetical protein